MIKVKKLSQYSNIKKNKYKYYIMHQWIKLKKLMYNGHLMDNQHLFNLKIITMKQEILTMDSIIYNFLTVKNIYCNKYIVQMALFMMWHGRPTVKILL